MFKERIEEFLEYNRSYDKGYKKRYTDTEYNNMYSYDNEEITYENGYYKGYC
ncbi:hypothetical protein [Terrisporobacter hibernicus]|uniref:Uncharacterized protein n=1 Tax=Terrisporobacter hibernicus TaxID=2813371 RepID=A0AAX2ZJG1_9FIRM|nr:hypothetical protein [Terrisporobacter hibernicus]UEL49171.1 hypothetical protein JW646_06920 [Terrisporobacter hibernicus]